MIFIVVRHLVRPEYAEEFPHLVEDFTAASRAEPGIISFEWSRSTDDPSVYFLVEAFRDAAAGQAHVDSGHFKAAIARMPGLLSCSSGSCPLHEPLPPCPSHLRVCATEGEPSAASETGSSSR